jgi:putative ABC transport system permease protein
MILQSIQLNLKIGLGYLRIFKGRTALAIAGVILGAISIITVSNLSLSLMKKTEIALVSFGKNMVIVRSGKARSLRRTGLMSSLATITFQDIEAIEKFSAFIEDILPTSNQTLTVRYRDIALTDPLIIGATPPFFFKRGYELEDGRFFIEAEDKGMKKVALIGGKVTDKLFLNDEPLMSYIFINKIPFQVIGILKPKGVDISGFDQDNVVIIPLQSYLKRFTDKPTHINILYIQPIDHNTIPFLKKTLAELLRRRHHIKEGNEDDFTVLETSELVEMESKAMNTVKIAGLIAAIVAFTISAMGIFSIMALMVNERKNEIGIRRAIGAGKHDIVLQFLIESSFISLVGTAGGVMLGLIISGVIFTVGDLPFAVSLNGISLAVGASVAVGILSGIYPAKKAASFRPIDILKSA